MHPMPVNICFIFLYIYVSTCIMIKCEIFGNSCYQINTKLKHKDLLKLRTQRKGEQRVSLCIFDLAVCRVH